MAPQYYEYHGEHPGDKFLSQVKWFSERYERMNEQLLTLSSTFIGFLAVELALIAQVDQKQIKDLGELKYLGIFGILLLGISLLLFFMALTSNKFDIPDLKKFQSAMGLDERKLALEPIRLMLDTDESDSNLQKSLELENKHINKYYQPALLFGGVAQFVIVLVLIIGWVKVN